MLYYVRKKRKKEVYDDYQNEILTFFHPRILLIKKKEKSGNIPIFPVMLVLLREAPVRAIGVLIPDDRGPQIVFGKLFRSLIQFNFLAEFLPLLNSLQRLRSKGPC